MASIRVRLPLAHRTCGGCTMCCTLLGVVELGKPPGKDCEHQVKGQGCGIYETRPDSCQRYSCAWVSDGAEENLRLTDKDRPENTGIILTIPPEIGPIGPAIHAYVAVESAHHSYWGRRLIEKLSKRLLVVIIYKNRSRSIVGPEDRVLRARRLIEEAEVKSKIEAIERRNKEG